MSDGAEYRNGILHDLKHYIHLQNDRAYNALVNIDCGMLPPSLQKMVLFMIQQTQHPATFKAGMVPLNLSTFIEV